MSNDDELSVAGILDVRGSKAFVRTSGYLPERGDPFVPIGHVKKYGLRQGDAELKLDRKIADKRVFPAVDIDPSGTRKEEILLAPEELAIVHKLRRALHSQEASHSLERLLDQLRRTTSNVEFLLHVSRST